MTTELDFLNETIYERNASGEDYMCPHNRQMYIRCFDCEDRTRIEKREVAIMRILDRLNDTLNRMIP